MRMETWEEVRRNYFELIDKSSDERLAYLAKCPEEVRRELESLLEADRAAGTFLESPPDEGLAPGSRCGAYRIMEIAGRGGMGIVYRGCRDDGEYQQEVAIKLMMDSVANREAERRFAMERQILAGLRHPNIVRLLDGGIVGGRRYLVMEWVQGKPVGAWAREAERTDSARLEVFRKICLAVQYAHQNLVIHRDLKPGNVLVQSDNEPKLLDFGIAKPISGDATEHTNRLSAVLTLAYASPEQVRGLPVTLASDIYSLGTLLYEMLEGSPAQAVAGKTLDSAIAAICESDAPKVSAKPGRRCQDLDSIIAKAMHKDPARRYASARELAEDVDRYREGKAVLARDATLRYVLARTVARHKTAAFAAAAVALLLVLSAVLIFRQARIAERERALAEQRFQTAQKAARVLISDAQRDLINVPGTLDARKMLVRKGLEYLEALSKDAAGNAELRRDIAFAYSQVSQVQWSQNNPHLGDAAGAALSMTKALDIWRQLFLETPSEPHCRGLVFALIALGALFEQSGKKDEQTLLAKEGVAAAERFAAIAPSDLAALKQLGNARFSLALSLRLSDHAGRIQAWTETLPIYEKILGGNSQDSDAMRNVALVEKYLAGALLNADRSVDAIPHCERALELDRKRVSLQPGNRQAQLDLAIDSGLLGSIHAAAGDNARGVKLLAESVEIRRLLAEADPKDMRVRERLAFALAELGHRLLDLGAPARARPHVVESIQIYESLQNDPRVTLHRGEAYYYMARVLYDTARKGDACRYWRLAQRDLQSAEPNQPEAEHLETASGYLNACPAALSPAAPRP